MTQDDNISDIIDIDPENVIENKPVEEKAPSSSLKSRLSRYGLIGALMLGVAVLGGWFYRAALSNLLPSDQIMAMSQRVDALEAANKISIKKLEAVVGLTDEIKSQLGAAQAAADDARKQVIGLKTETGDEKNKLAALEQSLALANAAVDELKGKATTGGPSVGSTDVTGLASRIDRLEKDVASLRQSNGSTKADTAQLSQSLGSLKAKIVSGSAYQDELHSISQMVPAAEGLDILASNATKGVMTPQALAEGLKSFAATIKKPDDTAQTNDESWWGRTANLFSGLVTVKTVGAIDWQQMALQCNALVEQGKIGDAVKLLDQNMESLPQPLQDWRINASKRFSVDQALEQLSRAVSREIAARG